jgi:hypothetical protein
MAMAFGLTDSIVAWMECPKGPMECPKGPTKDLCSANRTACQRTSTTAAWMECPRGEYDGFRLDRFDSRLDGMSEQ